jgi:hypothetical protein
LTRIRHATANVRPMTTLEPTARPKVFLGYAQADRAVAERLREALTQSGAHVMTNGTEDLWGRNLVTWLQNAIRASDFVVLLISPAAIESAWTRREIDLASDLDRRGVEVIPVLTVPTELAGLLPVIEGRSVVDLTKDMNAGVEQLIGQIYTTSRADFSTMTPLAFRNFVADLLETVGFDLAEERDAPDSGIDLQATYQRIDPFGSLETEIWLVETKLYSKQRPSVDAINQLAAYVSAWPGRVRGLLVTNAQLTSVAAEYAAELEWKSHVRLRVLDGVELRGLLRRFPAVTARHFPGKTVEPKADIDGNA